MINRLCVLLVALFVSGCASKQIDRQVVEKTFYVHVPVSSSLTTKVIPPEPIEVSEYVALTPEKRVEVLITYVKILMRNLKDANDKLDAIAKLDANNAVINADLNTKEEKRIKLLVDDILESLRTQK